MNEVMRVLVPEMRTGMNIELYNLENDEVEAKNVADHYPEVVDQIKKIMLEAHTPSPLYDKSFDNGYNVGAACKINGVKPGGKGTRGPKKKTGKPNVLFILADQWRAQATGYAGDPNVKTPNLDQLAKQGFNFKTAVSVCAICTPYRAALQTGRFPVSTGMYRNDLYLDPDEYCMAEIFKDAGYQTAYVGKWHLDGHGRQSYIPSERRQGYDYWKVLECTHDYQNSMYYDGNDPDPKHWEGYDVYAQTRDAQQYIRTHASDEKPFLFILSYGAPHFPHGSAPEDLKDLYPPESLTLRPNVPPGMAESVREELQGYYAHCTAIDRSVGELLKTLSETGMAENTIVVFTSDHGEMMGSHGISPRQKRHPRDEAILVPFLLRYPKLKGTRGRTVHTPINTPDILPTLLALANIEIPETIEGEDLSVLVKEPGKEIDRAALTMQVRPYSKDFPVYRGIRTAHYWYSEKPEQEAFFLFDMNNDPYQINNLVGNPEFVELQKKMERRLKEELIRIGDYPFKSSEQYDAHIKRRTGIDKMGMEIKGKKKKS